MFTYIKHTELHDMLDWSIGIEYNFQVSTGRNGKYYKNFLNTNMYNEYEKTYEYVKGDYESLWRAIFIMCDLFGKTVRYVAHNIGYTFCEADEKNMMDYLKTVQRPDSDACEIY